MAWVGHQLLCVSPPPELELVPFATFWARCCLLLTCIRVMLQVGLNMLQQALCMTQQGIITLGT